MALSVPVKVSLVSLVPVPVEKVRPAVDASDIVPSATDSVVVSVPPLASTSDTDRPEIASVVSLSVVCWPGTVSTGASLTATTWMVETAVFESCAPSFTVTSIVRSTVEGSPDVLEKVIAWMADW